MNFASPFLCDNHNPYCGATYRYHVFCDTCSLDIEQEEIGSFAEHCYV